MPVCQVSPLWGYMGSVLRLFSAVVTIRGCMESGLESEVTAAGPGQMPVGVADLGQLRVVRQAVLLEVLLVQLLEAPMLAVSVVAAEAGSVEEQPPSPSGAQGVAGRPQRTAWLRRSGHAAAGCMDMPWPYCPRTTQIPKSTGCRPTGTRLSACPVGNQPTTCPRRPSEPVAPLQGCPASPASAERRPVP